MYHIKSFASYIYNHNFLLLLALCIWALPLLIQAQYTEIPAGLPAVYNSSVAWGDYDNDGDLDILITGNTGVYPVCNEISRVYRNDGNGIFTDINAGLTGVGLSSVAWGDYDSDGDLDILLTGRSYEWSMITKIYRNDGNGVFTDINANLPGVQQGNAEWGDFDADGDLDIVMTGSTNGGNGSSYWITKVYRNDGNGIFTDVTSGLQVGGGSVNWGDFNNDGYLDILLTGYVYYPFYSVSVSRIYNYNGIDSFYLSAELPVVASRSTACSDYDNDGDLDILLTGMENGVGRSSKVYCNNGNNTFTDINAGLAGVDDGSVAWGDFDGDGYSDILLTGRYTGDFYGVISKIYRNNGNSTFSDYNVGLTGVSEGSVAWGDYDNDGDLDILLTGKNGEETWVTKIYRYDGNNPVLTLLSNPIINFGAMYIGMQSAPQSVWVRNTGTAPLIISNISYLHLNPQFEVVDNVLPLQIAVGDSAALQVRFIPQTAGSVNDSLYIHNNSANRPILAIKLTGTGEYVPPQPPDNISIIMNDYHAVISWDAVTETIFDTPIVPDYYLIFFNGSGDINDDYYFLGWSESLNYTHQRVGLHSPNMFYRIQAYKSYRSGRDDILLPSLTQDMTESEVMRILEQE